MSDLRDEAIDAIRLASDMSLEYYGNPVTLCYSGGKDSDAVLNLALESGVPFTVSHNHTTADAPETVRYIRKKFRELEDAGIKAEIHYPIFKGERTSMWSLIPKTLMPPTRLMRYCCTVLKERAINDSIALFGIRSCESNARSARMSFELIKRGNPQRWNLDDAHEVYNSSHELPEVYDCNLISGMKNRRRSACNPIINWNAANVYAYLGDSDINPLYRNGYSRVGCIGCPMSGKARYREFAMYPKYKQMYLLSFDRMLDERTRRGKETRWKSAEEVFAWWMEDEQVEGQMTFEGVDE